MFAKSKVSQSMIDAVNKVLGEEPVQQVQSTQPVEQLEQKETMLNETAAIKEPTKTGMRVYGGSYGNSAKAKQDQTKSSVDDIKEPTKKDIEKDSKLYRKTPGVSKNYLNPKTQAYFSKTGEPVKEELKGNQDKIDANHNDKIDAQDFKILKGKKKVKEGREFTDKLLETVRKSDVPAYLRKAKGDTPLTVADAKGPKKDSISAPENLAKARNEEVENEAYEASNAPITTDTLAGRMPGGKSNSFKSFKIKVKPLAKEAGETETPDTNSAEKTSARASIKAEEVQIEATIAGTPGWKEMKKDVTDKSGAVHSPMSRAKDLARQAFKTVSDKTKVKEPK